MDWPNHAVTAPYSHMQNEGERRLVRAGIENIRRHPLGWAGHCLRRVGRVLIGGPNWHFAPSDHYQGKRHFAGEPATALTFAWWTVGGTFVTVFGLVGLVAERRRHPLMAMTGLALIGYLVLLHAATHATPRFGVPFYPALVFGFCAYLSRRRPAIASVLLTIVCLSITTTLALYHRYRPAHVVAPSRLSYFTTDRSWKLPAGGPLPLVMEANRSKPAFNTCLFVRATTTRRDDADRRCYGILSLRAVGESQFDENAALWFEILPDGRERTYQVSVALQPAWRDRAWDALQFKLASPGLVEIRDIQIVQAH